MAAAGSSIRRGLLALIACMVGVLGSFQRLNAHNLNQRTNYLVFDDVTLDMIKARAKAGQQLLRAGDTIGLVLKATPDSGTPTGAGGYSTFFVPVGTQVVGAQYGYIDSKGKFVPIAMKGQSILSLGDGSISAKSQSALKGLELGPNIVGQKSFAVDSNSGVMRGTMAGVYADTGIFYSTDPKTVWQSWVTTGGYDNNLGTTSDNYITNNSGDVVIPTTRWDAEQLLAWGSKSPSALVDSDDQRGNTPWGMGSGVAGPESGYAWHFDKTVWDANASKADRMKLSVSSMGPWQRIQYAGSMAGKDEPGRTGSTLGYVGVDASSMGFALSESNPLPPTTSWNDTTSPKAIRMAWGNLELFRPEYSRIQLKILKEPGEAGSPFDSDGFLKSYADTFGGDAGGEYNNKDHLWRYYEPTGTDLAGKPFIAKHASKPIVAPGESFSYDLTVINFGFVTLTNVIVEDVLPSGVELVSAQPQPSSGSSTLVWNVGNMAPQTVRTFRLNVRAKGSGIQVNTASTRSDQTPKASTLEIIDITSQALLYPDKAVTPGDAEPGSTVAYKLVIENVGTTGSVTPMVITEYLPEGFTFQSLVSAKVNNGPAATGSVVVNNSNPARPLFTVNQVISAGKNLEITFNAKISDAQAAGTYTNSFSFEYGGKIMSTGALAPVNVGGARIGDTVFRDWNGDGVQGAEDDGLAGVTVQLWDAAGTTLLDTRQTDASGKYAFGGVPSPATYQVRTSGFPVGYVPTYDLDGLGIGSTNLTVVSVAAGQQRMDADFGYRPGGAGSIGGVAFNDIGKDGGYQAGTDTGIPNVTVRLYRDSNANGKLDTSEDLLLSTQTTDGAGSYNFDNLAINLPYIVDVDEVDADIAPALGGSPVRTTTADPRVIQNLAGALSINFGFWREQPGSIGDEVFLDNNGNGVNDAGDVPVVGVPVLVYSDADGNGFADPSELLQTVVTDIQGRYLAADLGPGSYVVKLDAGSVAIPPGYHLGVEEITLALEIGETRTDVDFYFVQLLSKAANRSSAVQGDQIVYTLTPNYAGQDSLTNLSVSDVVPTGTSYVSAGQGGTLNSFVSQPAVAGTAGNPAVQMATGTYTGNGVDNRSITGVGFQPDVVIIKGASSVSPVIRTSTMSGDASKLVTANSLVTNRIQSLLSDGFQVGNNSVVNSNGMRYDWIAFRAASGALSVGSYTGNGAASRTITGPGFKPATVFVLPANSSAAVMKMDVMEDSESLLFTGGSAATNLVTGLTSTGFQVGSGSNSGSTVYHYVAWKPLDGITATGVYEGSGTDNRNINDVGFQPSFLLLNSYSTGAAVMRPDSLTGDLSLFGTSTSSTSNNIQALLTDGFQVGSDSRVNGSGVSNYWAAFRPAAATPLTTTSLALSKTLCRNGDLVTLTMTLGSNTTIMSIVPEMPTVNTTGSATATLVSGPSPSSGNLAGGGTKTFTWTYQVDAGAGSGDISFNCGAASASYTFGEASSPSLNVSPSGTGQTVSWNLGSTTQGVPGSEVQNLNLYAFRGDDRTNFYRYDGGTGAWESRASAPGSVNWGAGLASNGSHLYALRGDDRTDFWRYDPATNAWTTRASLPTNSKEGGALVYHAPYFYAMPGDGTALFYRYNPSTNSWSSRASLPANVKKGGALTTDGTYIYALRGDGKNSFYRYDPSANSWTTRASVPANVNGGGSLVFDGNYLYAFRGDDRTDFYRYDRSANSWSVRASAPGTAKSGASLVFAGSSIYALREDDTPYAWKYSPSSNTWALNGQPAEQCQGGRSHRGLRGIWIQRAQCGLERSALPGHAWWHGDRHDDRHVQFRPDQRSVSSHIVRLRHQWHQCDEALGPLSLQRQHSVRRFGDLHLDLQCLRRHESWTFNVLPCGLYFRRSQLSVLHLQRCHHHTPADADRECHRLERAGFRGQRGDDSDERIRRQLHGGEFDQWCGGRSFD
ncbi:MAG: SdrD B-like domain-containing protein [Prosthecobacter sp.]